MKTSAFLIGLAVLALWLTSIDSYMIGKIEGRNEVYNQQPTERSK